MIIAFITAALALFIEPPVNPHFTDLLLTTAVVSQSDGFIGLEWRCSLDDDERCYAGLSGLTVQVGP